MARSFEQILQEELARPAYRSSKFWEAMVALGGTPEQVAPHVAAPESEVAGHMAKARGNVPYDSRQSEPALEGKSVEDQVSAALSSNWFRRVR